jgi:hypothetical protein
VGEAEGEREEVACLCARLLCERRSRCHRRVNRDDSWECKYQRNQGDGDTDSAEDDNETTPTRNHAPKLALTTALRQRNPNAPGESRFGS